MSNLDELEARIFGALGRIRAVLDEADDVGDTKMSLVEKLKTFDQLNSELADEVLSLREKRENDVRELDTLLTELRPLIQEVS